jgi:RING-variant domain
MARECSVTIVNEQTSVPCKLNEPSMEYGQYRFSLRTDLDSQSLYDDTASETKKLSTMCSQSVVKVCSTSATTSVARNHQCQSTSGKDLVLYNEVSQYSGAVPSYCEVLYDGEVHTSVTPPAALGTCASSASMESYARSDTNSSSIGPSCRICDSSDGYNRLISPCRCSGTSKFVHEQCLNVRHYSLLFNILLLM